MLRIWIGADRTILTNAIFAKIDESAKSGVTDQILIVPEQFSHEAERKLCLTCGNAISRFAEVLSLSRLSDRLAAAYGGAARKYLDKGGRLLAMALAAEQVSSRIKLFSSVLRKPEFLSELVAMVDEFQSYCLRPGALLDAASAVEGQFAQKLEELGLLFEAYLAVCANIESDPADKLARLAELLSEYEWVNGRIVYIDGFSDFTGAELEVLRLLIMGCKDVYLTLPTGPIGSTLLRLSMEQRHILSSLALRAGCRYEVLEFKETDHRSKAVQYLLDHLFSTSEVSPAACNGVQLCSFDSAEEECKAAVLRVKELLSQGARCREISIACTDLTTYEAPLRAACREAGLPVYVAGEVSLLSNPVINSVLCGLFAAVGGMEYEDVVQFLKSGASFLEQERCDYLDNYAFIWNIHGTQWEKEWTLHPRGFGAEWTEEDRDLLTRLNRDKETALSQLFSLRKGLFTAQTTGDMVLAVYQFLEELGLRRRLEDRANHVKGQLGQELVQIYEILITALEQTWITIGKTQRSPEDFCKLYQLLLTRYKLGTIPAGLDQVHISDLPDLRHRQSKHLLVLGAGDGRFPVYKTTEGILTEAERRRLLNHGVSMAPGRSDQIEFEMLRIYHGLCAAEETLWLSYAGDEPSWLFRRAAELTICGKQKGDAEVFLSIEALAAKRLRHDDRSELSVEGLASVECWLKAHRDYVFENLSEQTVRYLYGSPIMLSPSKIDQYAACQFEFFMQYGLKIKPRKQAKLDQPAFGTFVHAVLEQTVLRIKKQGDFRSVDRQTILEIALEEIASYVDAHFPEQTERDAYLFRRSKKEILEIVEDLWEELRNSLFQPEFCELKFAKDALLPLIVIQGKKTECQITGTIDRVDLYQEKNQTYVRVVDYKTGSKDFDYTDILNGAGLQMLIYLFALREFGGTYLQTGELEPAGVLYLPAKTEYPMTSPMPDEMAVSKEHREKRRRKGLIRSDGNLLAAMEADPNEPRYMPYKVGKNGPTGDLADRRQMVMLERHVLRTVEEMADRISEGAVTPNPVIRGQHTPCRYCDYQTVCHKDLGTQSPRILAETSAKQFWNKLEQEEANRG